MNLEKPQLAISSSPFLHHKDTTPKIMFQVALALVPAVLAALYYFGLAALLVIIVTIAGCLATEWFFDCSESNSDSGDSDDNHGSSLKDGSALVTGLLLALCLPPGFPLWMAFFGGIVAIGMGKVMWGGLGQNIFNPALLGRAFLQAAFPAAITTWAAPDGGYFAVRGTNLAMPFLKGTPVDGATSATPLSLMKFQHEAAKTVDLLFGNTGGSLGETCAFFLLLGGGYLFYKNLIEWRIPVSIFGTVFLFSGLLYVANPKIYPSPIFMLFSGGLMLGALFMATDMVTSPSTPKGRLIYGAGIGFLIVLIRVFGGLPEGVMYAILLMNSVTPIINRNSQNRVFGT